MALMTDIGDGSNTLFWKDRWLHGKKVKDIAPNICALVLKRIANKRKASEALQNMNWTADFQGAFSVILEFMVLFQQVEEVTLQPGVPDTHILPGRRMQPSSKGLFALSRQRGFGKLGLLENANFSCGWFSTTGAGPLIGWPGAAWTTQTVAPYVINRMRQSIICCSHVSL
jgi:hypothetical protein